MRGKIQFLTTLLTAFRSKIERFSAIKRWVKDSNPRYPFGQTGFRNRRIQPLCQPTNARHSTGEFARVKAQQKTPAE
jgi:hypothetical protein